MSKIFNPTSVNPSECCSLSLPNQVKISEFKVIDNCGEFKESMVYVKKCNKQILENLASLLNQTVKFLHPILQNSSIVVKPFDQWYINTTYDNDILLLKVAHQSNATEVNLIDNNYFIGNDAEEKARKMLFVINSILKFCLTFL